MELEIRTQNGIKVVKVKGRLCMGAPLDRFNTDMSEMLANGENKIVLDLAEMPTIDSRCGNRFSIGLGSGNAGSLNPSHSTSGFS